VLLASLVMACATTGSRPTGPEVDEIDIEGTHELSESEIKKKILTSESGLGFWPFGDKSYFDPNAWQADLRRIRRYYEARGYYQAEILEDQVITEKSGDVSLRVKVKEGEPTTISKVEIVGVEEIPPEHRKEVLKDLPLEQGDVFEEGNWAGLKGQIQTALRELGYAEASVQGEVSVDVGTRTA
jgi:translocation and assembly module TamA